MGNLMFSLISRFKKLLGISPPSSNETKRKNAESTDLRHKFSLSDIEITDEYHKVLAWIAEGVPLILVSGKAGTGKSTLIQVIRNKCRGGIVVVAPTGVSALNIKGVTIHSFFQFPPRILNAPDVRVLKSRKLYSSIDILVIDEISMVRADVMDAIDVFLRKNGRSCNLPFGGVQVVCVGDLYQLPPVITQTEEALLLGQRYSSPFFFSAKSVEGKSIAFVELTKPFRQIDTQFIDLLDSIRVGRGVEVAVSKINQTCVTSIDSDASVITLTTTNASADRRNAAELAKLPGQTNIYIGEAIGKFAIEKERLPSPIRLELKKGAQVIFTKNDEEKRWANGTIGRVVSMSDDIIKIKLVTDFPGVVVDVQRSVWESYQYEYNYEDDRVDVVSKGRYSQFPLMLAWAITIHKSQGKSLDKVRIDLGEGAFAAGQVYVALSRCRTLAGIQLRRAIEPDEVFVDERVKEFFRAANLRTN